MASSESMEVTSGVPAVGLSSAPDSASAAISAGVGVRFSRGRKRSAIQRKM